MANQLYEEPETSDKKARELDTSPYDGQGAAGNPSDPRGAGPDSPYYSRSSQVYDDEPAVNSPDPRNIGRANVGRGVSRPGLRQAETRGGLYNSAGDRDARGATSRSDQFGAESPDNLRGYEDNAGDQFASGFDTAQQVPLRDRATVYARRNKSKLLLVSGFGGGGIASLIVALFSLIPLKVEAIVQRLENRFTAPVTSALQATNQFLLQDYVRNYVLPAYKNCGTTTDRHCQVRVVTGNNPVRNLYHAWGNAHLETRLATEYGIEFKHTPGSRTWYLKGPSTSAKGVNIGRDGSNLDAVFHRTGERELLDKTIDAMKIETKWQRSWERFKIGRLLDQKYGIKRFIFFKGTRTEIRSTITQPIKELQRSAKLILAERVLKPRSELTFVAVKCVLTPDCHPDQTQYQPCTEGQNCEAQGAPTSEFDREEQTKLTALAAEYGITDLEKLNQIYTELSDKGFQKYLTEQVLQVVFSKTASERISSAIPIIGWINLSAELVNSAHDLGPKVKKISFDIAAASAVAYFMTYQSYGDEVHTGHVNPVQAGSMVDSLGPGVNDPNDPLVGGTAAAEGSPFYNDLINNSANGITTTKGAVGGPRDYRCNNGKRPPAGQDCSEDYPGQGNGTANAIHDFLDNQGRVVLAVAQGWSATIGQVFNFANSAAGGILSIALKPLELGVEHLCYKIPVPFGLDIYALDIPFPNIGGNLCRVRDAALAAAPVIIKGITTALIPNSWGSNMGGGRSFAMLAVGGSVKGKEACEQAGCQDVSGPVGSAIIKQQLAQERDQFDHQSFFARMFSTDDSYSLVSQLAIALPLNNMQGSLQSGFANLLGNPLGILANGFGSIFSSGHALAAATPDCDPYRVGCMAFPYNKIPKNLSTYWDRAHCGDTSDTGPIAQWQKASAGGPTDPNTGAPMHSGVEPCLLIQDATGSAGAVYDSSLLTKDDLAEVNPSGAPASTPSPTPTGTVSSNAQQVAQDMLNNPNITYQFSAKEDVTLASQGKPGTNNAPIDIRILQIVDALGQKHKVVVSAYESHGQGHSAGSDHYTGHAVDIASIDGQVAYKNITDFFSEIRQYSNGAVFLQGFCPGAKLPPSGMDRQPGDTCDHQHISVN